MTDMVNGESQVPSNFAPAPVTTQPAAPAPVEERTFKQSEVNRIVGDAKREVVERMQRESSMASHNAQAQQPTYQQHNMYQPQAPQANTPTSGISEQDLRRIAAEEAQKANNNMLTESARRAEEQRAQNIAQEFFTKVGAGEGGIPGFEKLVADAGLDLRSIPFHVQLANMVDNTRDVMEELVKNPTQIGAIQNLIDIDLRAGRNPQLALAAMKRLAESIKTNKQAANYKSPNEPLSQMRPSTTGTGSQGDRREVRDYRNNPKYKV